MKLLGTLKKTLGNGRRSMLSFKLTDNSKVRFRKEHRNTFSLAQGLPEDGGTCVNATAACLKVCYDGNLRKLYKKYAAVEDYNTSLVLSATYEEQLAIIKNTIDKWLLNGGCLEPFFRIHTGGEFFNLSYTEAWRKNIQSYPAVQFWAYTRSLFTVPLLQDLENLTLFLSCDKDNKDKVLAVYDKYKSNPNIAVAWMGDDKPENFPSDRAVLVCPEVTGKTKKLGFTGACARCRACVDRKLKSGKTRHVHFPIHR
jgi:hypothetical protein